LVERSIPGIENAPPEQLVRADRVGACPLREKEQGSGPIRPLRDLPALGVVDHFDRFSGAADTAVKLAHPEMGSERGFGRPAETRDPVAAHKLWQPARARSESNVG
jgi:hypothetical protein